MRIWSSSWTQVPDKPLSSCYRQHCDGSLLVDLQGGWAPATSGTTTRPSASACQVHQFPIASLHVAPAAAALQSCCRSDAGDGKQGCTRAWFGPATSCAGGRTKRRLSSTSVLLAAGGPGRWRVISLCAGGRHSMVLAVPDGSSIDRDGDATSSACSSPQLRPLSANGHAEGAFSPNGASFDFLHSQIWSDSHDEATSSARSSPQLRPLSTNATLRV